MFATTLDSPLFRRLKVCADSLTRFCVSSNRDARIDIKRSARSFSRSNVKSPCPVNSRYESVFVHTIHIMKMV
ncbi:MAG: hypothetical protein JWM99_3504 [Verrucomicrobiales bacterium]|nr:hypothetical protein [Verrucomicrobiales bacterium]